MLRQTLQLVASGQARDLRAMAAALNVAESTAAAVLSDLVDLGYLEFVAGDDPTGLDPRCRDCPTPSLCGPAGRRAWVLTHSGRRAAGIPAGLPCATPPAGR
jgi:hypothetical protein